MIEELCVFANICIVNDFGAAPKVYDPGCIAGGVYEILCSDCVFLTRRAVFIFMLALGGVVYPYNRGALYTALVLIYALTSGIAGYTASSFYKQLEGVNWVC